MNLVAGNVTNYAISSLDALQTLPQPNSPFLDHDRSHSRTIAAQTAFSTFNLFLLTL